jgi:septal ring factor EnvC (AmiA/AmiB activator)
MIPTPSALISPEISDTHSQEVATESERSVHYPILSTTNQTYFPTRVRFPSLFYDIVLMAVDLDRKRELEQRISEYSDQKRTLEQEYRKSKDEEDRLHHRVRELDEEKATFTAEVVAINNTVTSLQSAQTRLAQQLDKKRMAEEKPDTTEEEIAKIHEKQVQSVMERVEHALAMEVFLRKMIFDFRNMSKRPFGL